MLSRNEKLIPGYKRGWATYGASAAPESWEGIIGAWAPFLGPTGDILRGHSEYKNNGTIIGPTWGPNELIFNGGADKVDMGTNPIFNITDKITLMALVLHGTSGSQHMFAKRAGAAGAYILGTDASSKPFVLVWIGGVAKQAISPIALINGKWYLVVGTYDGFFVRLFINNVLVHTIAATGSIDVKSSDPLLIGWGLNNSFTWKGRIRTVGLWNRAFQLREPYAMFGQPSPARRFVIPSGRVSRYHDLNGLGGQGQMSWNPLG